jgi:predicted HAD superfamily Cof-like phosphohydrolase
VTVFTNQDKVEEFMTTFGQEVKDAPGWPEEKVLQLRIALVEEEVDELLDGVDRRDITNVAKELVDILYVVYGMGRSLGIDLNECFDEVHKSNMSKLQDGEVLYSVSGKVLKGKDYFEPEIDRILYRYSQVGHP